MSEGDLSYLKFIISMCLAHLEANNGEAVVKIMKRYIKEYEKVGINND